MARYNDRFDWSAIADRDSGRGDGPTPHRPHALLALFLAGCVTIFASAVQLEMTGGEEFRTALRQTRTEVEELPAGRGRILARDGTVLAEERDVVNLAIHYRYLQRPADPVWLARTARGRLSRSQRRDTQRVRREEQAVEAETQALHARLAKLCNTPIAEWKHRLTVIDARVARAARKLNERGAERLAQAVAERELDKLSNDEAGVDRSVELASHLFPTRSVGLAPVVTREQQSYHTVACDLAPEIVEEISQDPDSYPGALLVRAALRDYPGADLAAQLVGYLDSDSSPVEKADTAVPRTLSTARAVAGIEAQADERLRGTPGKQLRLISHSGDELWQRVECEPQRGQDVVLAIHPALQAWSQRLLDRELNSAESSNGGAVVVIDVDTGDLLAAASAPRFDPNDFSRGMTSKTAALLARSDAPLVDRTSQMALPPGSVFKPLVAIALLENRQFDPTARFTCQGYLEHENAWRCALFRRQGIGHGDLNLADALALSCNVYFFHHATELGAAPILEWARRLGFGASTGSGIAGEATGNLPRVDSSFLSQSADDLARGIAIGQHEITATPLQVARMMAAIATGRLVTPRLMLGDHGAEQRAAESGLAIGVRPSTLLAVRAGLLQAVQNPDGTAHDAWLPKLAIAGKTGTAQTGGDQPDHCWFAGYFPAQTPRFAFCVTLEHGGDTGRAVLIGRELAQRMAQAGLLAESGSPAR
jgi:penicillin-binding protein 2